MISVLSKIWNSDLKLKEIPLYKYSRDPGGDWHVRKGGIPIYTLVKSLVFWVGMMRRYKLKFSLTLCCWMFSYYYLVGADLFLAALRCQSGMDLWVRIFVYLPFLTTVLCQDILCANPLHANLSIGGSMKPEPKHVTSSWWSRLHPGTLRWESKAALGRR